MDDDITYAIDTELTMRGYKRLGWGNFWDGKEPPELLKCRNLLHNRTDKSHSIRGSDHTIFCDDCRFFYKLDTSD